MLRGLTTARFHVGDLDAAKRWYTELLGVEPYFERPGYAEFRIGDYQHELGLMDSAYLRDLGDHDTAGTGGPIVYWAVDDVRAVVARLLSLGAREHEPVREFGEGFVAGCVTDPFGNVLGVMENSHYLEVLASRG
ncbi:VOC family protein [Streptomyces calidiresistens]|uniref:VOC family protein n=1 Tax=Streptomyces calidiresistens TaxID=1485586 RepID=A0A7W3T0X8_9ACTN|nr:VOC family protein [Streptomyces calidiresistens]MBB0228838.1 VOC family protein [Streptomyces calidiresistens]